MFDSLTYRRMPTQVTGLSRRGFLKVVAVALAGGALVTTGERVMGTTWVPQPLPVSLQRSTFARYLGETFQVNRQPSDAMALQLIQVGDLPSTSSSGTGGMVKADHEHCFSILFRAPADRLLAQATYRFEHPQIGSFPLFIVPMTSDQSTRYYEAIFNCPLG
jgi:hypothetical protein